MKKIFISFLIISSAFNPAKAEKIVQNVVTGSTLAVVSYFSYKKAHEEFRKSSTEIIPEVKLEASKGMNKVKKKLRQFKNDISDKSDFEKKEKNVEINKKYYIDHAHTYYKRYQSPLNWTVFATTLAIFSVCRFVRVFV